MIVVLDNYDSFTYNLVQYLAEITGEKSPITVVRNDAVTVDELLEWKPSHLVLSPGPCTPDEAGISLELVRRASGIVPILGVCLGHQTIAQAFGGSVIRASRVMHGKTSVITHTGSGLFDSIPQRFTATRYHSLIADRAELPDCLAVVAETADAPHEVMAIQHTHHRNTWGVQFHPEAILTEYGKLLLSNFLFSSTAVSHSDVECCVRRHGE